MVRRQDYASRHGEGRPLQVAMKIAICVQDWVHWKSKSWEEIC